jgi:iron complex transport system permease protein
MKLIIAFFALIIIVVAPFFGETSLIFSDLWDPSSTSAYLFYELRLPRLLIAFLSGGILAVSGLIFQIVFRNPLTTPYTLGVASGATLGSAVAILFLPVALAWLIYFFSFFGALLTIAVLFVIARNIGSYHTNTLLLVGIALSFFYAALLMVLYAISDYQQSYAIMRFTMGSLSIVGFTPVIILALMAVILLGLLRYFQSKLRYLLTSYEHAYLHGLAVDKLNWELLITVSLAVGVTVSFVGPIGFVGLIVPHAIKQVYQQSSDQLLLPTFFYGGVFLVFSDLIARNLSTGWDLPIGVITSLMGAPFFIYIMLRKR